MRVLGKLAAAAGCFVAVTACTSTPSMAPDYSLPIQAIVLHCVCELRDAFDEFSRTDPKKRPKGFPQNWSASISLTPKVDTDFNARAGLTGTSKGPNSNTFFNTWTLGSAPGAGIDFKSNKGGALTFYVHATDLLDPKSKLDCTNRNATNHALAQDFGIKDWLQRLMQATYQDELDDTVSTDKPVFSAAITIKMDAAGSFTYNFPFGTDFGSMGGWYQLDEQISIAFTKDPPAPSTIELVEFPPVKKKTTEDRIKKSDKLLGVTKLAVPKRAPPRVERRRQPQGVSEDAKRRLDNIQLEQTLRSLQLRP